MVNQSRGNGALHCYLLRYRYSIIGYAYRVAAAYDIYRASYYVYVADEQVLSCVNEATFDKRSHCEPQLPGLSKSNEDVDRFPSPLPSEASSSSSSFSKPAQSNR